MYYLPRMLNKMRPIARKNSTIHKTAKAEAGTQIINSSMGKYTYCGYDCMIINTKIGSFCSIAGNVKIGLADHPLSWISTSCAFYYGHDSIKKNLARNEYKESLETLIENDVWIAENVLIKAGLHIATGAVIGSGAVLTHNVGPYEIWVGNPARMIRKRFDDKTIEKLLASKYWEMDNTKLYELSEYATDINQAIKYLERETSNTKREKKDDR